MSTVIGKSASLATQIALGWFLSEEDFGLYALTLSVALSVSVLRNGGTSQMLIQRGSEYGELASNIYSFASIFNLLAMLILLVIAPFASKACDAPQLIWMIVCIAISIPLGGPAMVLNAKLAIDKCFRTLSQIVMMNNLLRQGSTVGLAFLGFGPLSFVLPIIIEAIFGSLAGWWCVKAWPRYRCINFSVFWNIFSETRWIMLGALAIALTLYGDYLALGFLEDKATLGIYFFGFQLVTSIAVFFTNSIESVMLPMLAPLTSDPERQAIAFSRAASGICSIAIPLSVALAMLSEPVAHLLWRGKWDAAIPVMQLLFLSMPAWLLVSLSRSLIEARGMWRLRLLTIGLYGIGSMVMAAIGASLGGLISIAAWIAGYRFIYGITQMLFLSRYVGLSIFRIVWLIFLPLILSLIAAALSHYLVSHYSTFSSELVQVISIGFSFAFIFMLLSFSFQYRQWLEVLTVLYRRKAI